MFHIICTNRSCPNGTQQAILKTHGEAGTESTEGYRLPSGLSGLLVTRGNRQNIVMHLVESDLPLTRRA